MDRQFALKANYSWPDFLDDTPQASLILINTAREKTAELLLKEEWCCDRATD